MSRFSSTFFLLALALGLVCYLTFIDKKLPGTKEREEADAELYKLDPATVNGLEINNAHGTFIFQKKNDRWEIKRPVNAVADSTTVEQVINQIAFAQPQRTIHIDPSDPSIDAALKQWGLAPPEDRVVIHTPGKDYELLIGRKMAINDSVWARGSGRKKESVRVIPSAVKTIVEKELSDFRSHNVFDFDADKVTGLSSQVAGGAGTAAQECEVDLKDGKWVMQKPLVARASTLDVETALTQVLAARVDDFITDGASNLSQYGLTSPSATLSITVKGEPETVLQIGGPVPGRPDQVYAQRVNSDSVFTMTKTAVDDLFKQLPNVRDRHVFPFDAGKVDALSIQLPTKEMELKKVKGVWNLTSEGAGMADVAKVTDLLSKLGQLETTPVLKDSATDLKPYGLDKPLGRITVTSSEFKPSLTLLIGKTETNLIYVRNSAEPFIYSLAGNALDFVPAGGLGLRDGRVINLSLKDVRKMSITAPNLPTAVLVRSAGGTWGTQNVKDRMVDSTKAETQASLFCQLQTRAWLGPVQPAYALAKPILSIAVQTDMDPSVVLHVGAALPDGTHAAQIEGNPTVFALDDGDFGIFNASSLQLIPPSAQPATNGAPAPAAAPAGK